MIFILWSSGLRYRPILREITNILEEHVPSMDLCFSQMSVTTYQSLRCHNPEDDSMKQNRCESIDRVDLCTYRVSNAVSLLSPVTRDKRSGTVPAVPNSAFMLRSTYWFLVSLCVRWFVNERTTDRHLTSQNVPRHV
jgi:hypothetical protein